MTLISKSSLFATSLARPQSFITKGKQRLKQFTDTVYLKNGDEFEIELFNPTQNKVLAKIEMNGNSIGNGIILRPGERVFLERYLDEAKKFLFETYTVNGNNEEVQQAIANNGDVVVKFYNEILSPTYVSNGGSTITINNPTPYWNNTGSPFTYTTHNTLGATTFNPTSVTTTGTNASYFSNSSLTSGTFSTSNTVLKNNSNSTKRRITKNDVTMDSLDSSPLRSVETGRVEKGSNSNQSFTYDTTSFYSWTLCTDNWKIKPQSTKPLVREDLVTYCTECGSKRKKDTHKFCPHCGTKF
jgi:hypothetical protein